MRRWALVGTAVLAIALAISAVLLLAGGEQRSAMAEAGERIDGQSMRMNMDLEMTTPDGDMRMSGEVLSSADGSTGTMDVDVSMQGAPESIPMELLVIRDDVWMRSSSFKQLLPPGKRWVHGVETTTPAESLTPAEYSRFLAEADEVDVIDEDVAINGEPTTYYKGLVDARQMAEEVGGETEERIERVLGDATIKVPVEAWIGRDGLPARLKVSVDQAGQHMAMTADILEYGVPVEVEPPPAERTIEEAEFDRLTEG